MNDVDHLRAVLEAATALTDVLLSEIKCGDALALHAWVNAGHVYTLANELRRAVEEAKRKVSDDP